MHMPPKPFMAKAKKIRMDRSEDRCRDSHGLFYKFPFSYVVLTQQDTHCWDHWPRRRWGGMRRQSKHWKDKTLRWEEPVHHLLSVWKASDLPPLVIPAQQPKLPRAVFVHDDAHGQGDCRQQEGAHGEGQVQHLILGLADGPAVHLQVLLRVGVGGVPHAEVGRVSWVMEKRWIRTFLNQPGVSDASDHEVSDGTKWGHDSIKYLPFIKPVFSISLMSWAAENTWPCRAAEPAG